MSSETNITNILVTNAGFYQLVTLNPKLQGAALSLTDKKTIACQEKSLLHLFSRTSYHRHPYEQENFCERVKTVVCMLNFKQQYYTPEVNRYEAHPQICSSQPDRNFCSYSRRQSALHLWTLKLLIAIMKLTGFVT